MGKHAMPYEGHDENEHEIPELEDAENDPEHEHGPFCFSHVEHWRDDSVYAHPEFDPDEKDMATIDSIRELLEDIKDEKVYRFALITVNENGTIQALANPGMSPHSMINLLANAIRILAFQEGALEAAAQSMINRGIGTALRGALQGDNEIPDLSGILGGIPAKPVKTQKKRRENKDDMREGYL